MAKLFEGGDGEQTCPGEEECPTWLSSAPDAAVRCPSCPRRSTSGDVGPDSDWLVDQIERFVSERDSGFGLPDDLSPLEKELVIIWDQHVKANERAHQQRVAQFVEAIIARGGQG